MVAKTKNDFVRLLMFLLAFVLIIALPGFIISQIFQMANFEIATKHRFILFMVWLIFTWVFILKNWKILNKRLSTIPK
jgi:uncharacterized protein YqhQ